MRSRITGTVVVGLFLAATTPAQAQSRAIRAVGAPTYPSELELDQGGEGHARTPCQPYASTALRGPMEGSARSQWLSYTSSPFAL